MATQRSTEPAEGSGSASFDLNVVGDPWGSWAPCSVCGWRMCDRPFPTDGRCQPPAPSQTDARGLGAVPWMGSGETPLGRCLLWTPKGGTGGLVGSAWATFMNKGDRP